MSNLGYIQMSLKDPLLSVSFFCHLASIILCALILSETLALYKSFTYLLTYLLTFWPTVNVQPYAVVSVICRLSVCLETGIPGRERVYLPKQQYSK